MAGSLSICCIICCICGFCMSAAICAGLAPGMPPIPSIPPIPPIPPIPGIPPIPPMPGAPKPPMDGIPPMPAGLALGAPQGLGRAVVLGTVEGGDAALLGLLVEGACWCIASIMGSCTSSYMRRSALKPPGRFSSCDMARSWERIICCMLAGLRIISIVWRSTVGSLSTCRTCGLASSICCICSAGKREGGVFMLGKGVNLGSLFAMLSQVAPADC